MGEMTSLARQLQKLAAPQTGILVQGKVRQSFLFDPKEAASLDRDTVFSYGSTGLDKLQVVDPIFERFRDSLFSLSGLDFERSVQTAEINQKLDSRIHEFLTTLSPYFLLRGAHEALEWLIYRYHIHLFNVDSLIACILPHYHTRIFVRALQLVDLKSKTGRWYWLKSSQESGKPLELTTLIYRMNSDTSFCHFVFDLVTGIIGVFHEKNTASPVIAFATVSAYYAVKQNAEINHNYVTKILPFVLNGLKSDVDSYVAGSYLILSKLLVKVKISSEVLDSVVLTIFKNLRPNLTSQGLTVIVLIFQHQKVKLSEKMYSKLAKNKDVLPTVCWLSDQYASGRFFLSFIQLGITSAFKELETSVLKAKNEKIIFARKVLRSINLDDKQVQKLFRIVLKIFIKLMQLFQNKKKKRAVLKQFARSTLKCIEERWPKCFNNAISSYFELQKNRKIKKLVWNLINKSVVHVEHKVVVNAGFTMHLGINHPNPAIRSQTLTMLVNGISDGKIQNSDFLTQALFNCLQDKNPDLNLLVLSLGSRLLQLLPTDELFPLLFAKLKQPDHSRKIPVRLKILELLCHNASETERSDLQLLDNMVPFLFSSSCKDLKFLIRILTSDFCSRQPVLKHIATKWLESLKEAEAKNDESLLNILNGQIYQAFQNSLQLLDKEKKHELARYYTQNRVCDSRPATVFYSLGMLQSIMSFEDCGKDRWNNLTFALSYLESVLMTCKIAWEDSSPDKSMKHLKKGKLPFSMTQETFLMIIDKIPKFQDMEKSIWCPDIKKNNLSANGHCFKLLMDLFTFLIKLLSSSQKQPAQEKLRGLFRNLLQHHLQTTKKLFWFLSYRWSYSFAAEFLTGLEIVDLQIAQYVVEKSKDSFDWFFSKDSSSFIALIAAVYSPVEDICLAAFILLKQLLEKSKDSTLAFRKLAEEICNRFEETKCDRNELLEVTSNWFSSMTDDLVRRQCFTHLLHMACSFETPCHLRYMFLLLLKSDDSPEYMGEYLDLLQHYVCTYKNNKVLSLHQLDIFQLLLKKFSPATAQTLTMDSKAFNDFLDLLDLTMPTTDGPDRTIQKLSFGVITKDFFMNLPSPEVQQKVLDTLVTLYVSTETSEVNDVVGSILKKLCVHAYLLLKDLPESKDSLTGNLSLKEIKSRKLHTFQNCDLLHLSWKKIIVLVEVIQSKKKLKNKELLVSELFRILNLTLDWESTTSVEYLRQLILSAISNCCSHMDSTEINEREFQVELIIQCIRASDNPKTHRQALMLLNLAATMFPDYVLKNVMSIFTFMGSNLIRQDDSYSFQVISQTIETIVPALNHANNQQKNTDDYLMPAIVRMFVDTIPDIPRHRLVALFTKLVNTLGPSEYLWIPLAQICEKYGTSSALLDVYNAKRKGHIPTIIDFALVLFGQFQTVVQFETCIKLIQHLEQLPDHVKTSGNVVQMDTDVRETKEPFDWTTHSEQELQEYKCNVLCLVNLCLVSEIFISQLAEMESQIGSLEPKYELLLESTMNYLKKTCQSGKKSTFLKDKLIPLIYDVLNNVNSLLPCKLFIKVVKNLLASAMISVQQKAIEMLNAKLEHQRSFFAEEYHKSLLKLMKPLLRIIKGSEEYGECEATSKILVTNRQTAVFAVHLMCRVVGSEHSMKFYKVVPVLVDIIGRKLHNQLVINALLCLAELCRCLNAMMLPHLNTFMPEILKLLQDETLLMKNDNCSVGLIMALQEIIESLGPFLSSHIGPVIVSVCHLAASSQLKSKKSVQDRLCSLIELISSETASRVLLPSIQKSYDEILKTRPPAVKSLTNIFKTHISKMNYLELEDHVPQLQSFCLHLLDFRNQNKHAVNFDVQTVEAEIISSVLAIVVKMSEGTFRTFYNNIYKWAFPTIMETDADTEKLRVLTFYRLTLKLAETLKSLFVPSSKLFMRNAASLMDANNSSKVQDPYFGGDVKMSMEILNYCVEALNFCFLHDSGHLADRDCFNVVMQPLVDQIENQLFQKDAYEVFIENRLAQCIAHFIAMVSDSALWKSANYQVLLKTRNSSPQVRFATLQVIREIVNKMGENFLVLLPESIPFLAEIMEDESFEVEQECQDVIANMEKILGEPIKKYF